jgi:hypothetical protein
VRRFLSAIAFVVMLAAVLGAAACGQRFERAPGAAPAPGDLAADALHALEAAGSAHFVADIKTRASGDGLPPFSVHLEGDASTTALDATASVSFGAGTLNGRLMVGEHAFFIQFMDQWYGEDDEGGLVDAFEEAKKEHDGEVWNELATAEGLRRNFGELFDGEVIEGPVLDGVATWQFEGRLNADAIAEFARRYDAQPTDREEQELRLAAEASRVVLIVGQDDHLPRKLEFSVELSDEALRELEGSSSMGFAQAQSFTSTLELSEFGKPVELEPPADFKPLDELFENLFSGLS